MPYRTVVVRYGEHIAPPDGTVAAHREVIDDRGYVWWGKIGAPLSVARINKIRSQREDGSMTVYFLTGRNLTAAEVDDFSPDLPPTEWDAIPSYYRSRRKSVSGWFRVRSLTEMPADEASRLRVESSARPLSEAIGCSMCPFFYVSAG